MRKKRKSKMGIIVIPESNLESSFRKLLVMMREFLSAWTFFLHNSYQKIQAHETKEDL